MNILKPDIPPNSAWLTTWAKEASGRIAAYERGELEAEDFDIAMDRLRKQIE